MKGDDDLAQKATVIAVVNQKGGTGKTTTCENLGIGLAMEGKKVLMVDVDPKCRIRHFGSTSTMSTFLPSMARPIPRFSQVVVLPVPPF